MYPCRNTQHSVLLKKACRSQLAASTHPAHPKEHTHSRYKAGRRGPLPLTHICSYQHSFMSINFLHPFRNHVLYISPCGTDILKLSGTNKNGMDCWFCSLGPGLGECASCCEQQLPTSSFFMPHFEDTKELLNSALMQGRNRAAPGFTIRRERDTYWINLYRLSGSRGSLGIQLDILPIEILHPVSDSCSNGC